MKKLVALFAVLAVIAVTVGIAVAADLPRSGKFNIHSGWKGVGETNQVADNHMFWYGGYWGVTYNDAGEGLLHMGGVLCTAVTESISGKTSGKGLCAWGDADGDRIFTDWSGADTPVGEFSGLNKITGGTGKFAGVQGTAPFQCRFLNASGQGTCKQQFEYRLP